MSEATPKMVPYTSLSRVLITPISEQEVDERFRHAHQPYYPRILCENNFCVVMCASHEIALTFMDTFRYNPGQIVDWYLEEGEEIDPSTLPPWLTSAEAEDELESFSDEEEDHPDLCQFCMRDYVDSWGRCESCDYGRCGGF
jgi:hypothetical protein